MNPIEYFLFYGFLLVVVIVISWPLLLWIVNSLTINRQNKLNRDTAVLKKKYIASQEEFNRVKEYVINHFDEVSRAYRNDLCYICGDELMFYIFKPTFEVFCHTLPLADVLTALVLAKEFKKKKKIIVITDYNYRYVLRLLKRINELIDIPEAEDKLFWFREKKIQEAHFNPHFESKNDMHLNGYYKPWLSESNINYWHDDLRNYKYR